MKYQWVAASNFSLPVSTPPYQFRIVKCRSVITKEFLKALKVAPRVEKTEVFKKV